MFERVYLGPEAGASMRRSSVVIRALFDHYCAHPEEIPPSTPDGDLARRVTDYLAGMTDRYCVRMFEALERAGGVRAVTRYTADSRDRVLRRRRHGRAGLRPHRAAPRRRQQLLRPVPVSRRADRLLPRAPGREALPLLRLPGLGRPVHVRDGDRGARLQRRWNRSPIASASRSRPRTRTRRPPRRQRRERLYTLLARATAYYARYLWESTEAAPAREYLLGRGLTEETLREFRVGYAPSAWDRMWRASRTAGFTDAELLEAGLVQRSKSNPGRSSTASASGSCFPPPTRAAGCVASAPARCAKTSAAQVPEHLRQRPLPQAQQLFGIDLARACAARAGRMILVEGYTDVSHSIRPGCATRSGSWARH